MSDDFVFNNYKGQLEITIDDRYLEALPDDLFEADIVKTLTIWGISLKALADKFDQLQTLEKLVLKEIRGITDLPRSIAGCKNLRELDLVDCHITILPDNFGDLSQLEIFVFDNGMMSIYNIPDSFSRLTSLKILHLSANFLLLAPHLAAFTCLEELHISDSMPLPNSNLQLALPAPLCHLSRLRSFRLTSYRMWSDDMTSKLPQSIGVFKYKYYNSYSRQPFPISIAKIINVLSQAESIAIEGSISEIDLNASDAEILPNNKLMHLRLNSLFLAALPPTLGNLRVLRTISLGNIPDMQTLAPSLYDCSQLVRIIIGNMNLTAFADGIERLTNLDQIIIERAKLITLPDGIFTLPKLKTIVWDKAPKTFKDAFKIANKKVKIKKSAF
jgi:leucine-rich repeat protein SHOC2